jgi:hypothetical protein
MKHAASVPMLTGHIGWKSRSGKKRLNSIMIPAVMVNQIAENTGAVVRNFFIAGDGG